MQHGSWPLARSSTIPMERNAAHDGQVIANKEGRLATRNLPNRLPLVGVIANRTLGGRCDREPARCRTPLKTNIRCRMEHERRRGVRRHECNYCMHLQRTKGDVPKAGADGCVSTICIKRLRPTRRARALAAELCPVVRRRTVAGSRPESLGLGLGTLSPALLGKAKGVTKRGLNGGGGGGRQVMPVGCQARPKMYG